MSNQLLLDSAYRDRNVYPLSTNYVIYPKENAYNCPCQGSTKYKNPIAIDFPNVHSGTDASNVVLNCISLNTIVLDIPPIEFLTSLKGLPLVTYFEQFFQNIFCNCTFLAKHPNGVPGMYLHETISKSVTDPSGTYLYLADELMADVSGQPYCIFKNMPYNMGVLSSTINAGVLDLCSNAIIPVDASGCNCRTDISGYPCGQYFIMLTDTDISCNPKNRGQVRQIKYYDNTNHIAYLDGAFPVTPISGESYEIYKAFDEGLGTLWYSNGIKDKNFTYCREVRLAYVVLPNFFLASGNGGKLDNYRFINLKISNDGINNSGSSTISTNNRFARYMTFTFPINLQLFEQRFFTLTPSTNKCFMIDFNQPIQVEFTLPNGDPIIFEGDDRWSNNYFPLFLGASDLNDPETTLRPDIGVIYPGYSPDTPVPFRPLNLVQTAIFFDFIC